MKKNHLLVMTLFFLTAMFFTACSDDPVQPDILSEGKWTTEKTSYEKIKKVLGKDIIVNVSDTIAFETKKFGNKLWITSYDVRFTSDINGENVTEDQIFASNAHGLFEFNGNKVSIPLKYRDENNKDKYASNSYLEIVLLSESTATVRYNVVPVDIDGGLTISETRNATIVK